MVGCDRETKMFIRRGRWAPLLATRTQWATPDTDHVKVKVIVCGDRKWGVASYNGTTSEVELAQSQRNTLGVRIASLSGSSPHVEVIVGGALGADTYAEVEARSLGLDVRVVQAEWSKYGNDAGPKRNREMLALKPDLVIAFHPDLLRSRGTRHMVTIARKAGVTVEVIGT